MKVSIVTPVLNCQEFIRETIESVINQKGDFELEYIIKDGGSTDGTLDILNEYKDKVTIVTKKDSSVAEAINLGMGMATGDIGAVLMGDDTYEEGAILKVVDAFKAYPQKRWLYGKCKIINSSGGEIRKSIKLYKNLVGFYYSKHILMLENYISEPAVFWRMSLFCEIGGWHSVYIRADDYHMWMKMAQVGSAIHIRKYLSSFRLHSASFTSNYFEGQIEEELKIASNYCNSSQLLVHKVLCLARKTIYRTCSKINRVMGSRG